MKSRFVWSLGLALVLVVSMVAGFGVGPAQGPSAANASIAQGGYTFEGCWSYWAAGPCYDIYKDASGNFWKCKKCGTTNNPPSGCSRISQQTLNTGYWCS